MFLIPRQPVPAHSSPATDQPPHHSERVDWHTLSCAETLNQLTSSAQEGLSTAVVSQRSRLYGPNAIEDRGGRRPWDIVVDQFRDIMLLMLIAVAAVSAILDGRSGDFPKDAIAILVIVSINAALGYLQESRAEKSLAALKKMSSPSVRVIRDGQMAEISATALVPGDIMVLDAGVQVAADARLLDAAALQVQESALTGEATAVGKNAQTVLPPDTVLGDRINLVFQGTEVVQGRGTAIVTHTGQRTELGQIAELLQGVEAEPTPLQRRMDQLGTRLVFGSLALVAVVIGIGLAQAGWSHFEELLEVSLSMAVAVVPEGLPAVITVTLALGTQRMVQRHALIRKLPAVETLGSVTTICSDKTGTLTQNKMVVQVVQVEGQSLRVTGEGYAPDGEFYPEQDGEEAEGGPSSSPDFRSEADVDPFDPEQTLVERPIAPHTLPALRPLFLVCGVCNDAALQKEQGTWAIVGDPTEGALLTLAAKGGLNPQDWRQTLTRVGEYPFSSERKRMAVVMTPAKTHPTGHKTVLADIFPAGLAQSGKTDSGSRDYWLGMKGSPEQVLACCDRHYINGNATALTSAERDRILAHNNVLAQQGLRVLGFAYRWLESCPNAAETAETHCIWLGMTGMLDAPRPEVRQAVRRCRQAGIRPIMITGDHPLTAKAIATDLGIATAHADVLRGQDMATLDQPGLAHHVGHVSVYARVAPEHKLRIVKTLQQQGGIIAMTGDGVNDAPALKQANIGIAMGITGTDVSKEASDMVLLDDNFASIVAATEEGRVVYDNIRRFVKYILGSNIGEVITIAASPILLPLGGVPLSPLQILWMNLVTDGVPALALAVEPAEPNVMTRPPHPPNESIFARGLGAYMIRIGIVFSIVTIALMVWAYHYTQGNALATGSNPERWKTMVFTSLCLAQMGHAIAVRSDTRLTIEMNPFSNPYLLGSVLLTTAMQLLLIYVPFLQAFFDTYALSATELAICFGVSSAMFIWVELEKLLMRWWANR